MSVDVRFIPTRVGQMELLTAEKVRRERFIPTRVGQMHIVLLCVVVGVRFIPTRVGQMFCKECGGIKCIAVHPHACGADKRRIDYIQIVFRFIPTRVGQMSMASV